VVSEESTTPDVEEIRSWVEADNYDEFAAFMEQHYAADAVWDLGNVGLGTYEGLATILAFLQDYWSTWEDHHHYVEDIVDLGHGVGYMVLREVGRMKGSDARVRARAAWITIWEDGKVVRNTAYADVDEARADAERLAQGRR
jgi:ketosteroid isomerase-like protein